MLQITIPKPCHEDWNAMTPTSRGAFCSACAKDVVDFTTMTDNEVQQYLLQQAGEKVCGKFYKTQLHRIRINIPGHIFYTKIEGWKKFMAVVMIAFGSMLFGCEVTMNTPVMDVTKLEKSNFSKQALVDSTNLIDLVGEISIPVCEATKGAPVMTDIVVTTTGLIEQVLPSITQGDIEVKPVLLEEIVSYKMNGGIILFDSANQKVKNDSLQKLNQAKDTTICKG